MNTRTKKLALWIFDLGSLMEKDIHKEGLETKIALLTRKVWFYGVLLKDWLLTKTCGQRHDSFSPNLPPRPGGCIRAIHTVNASIILAVVVFYT